MITHKKGPAGADPFSISPDDDSTFFRNILLRKRRLRMAPYAATTAFFFVSPSFSDAMPKTYSSGFALRVSRQNLMVV